MILQIKLLSDLCASSGDVYNSYVDTEVVSDELGLPYIPAKRIKGCIREAALELVQWGIYSEDEYTKLFGKEGNTSSLFSLDNAYLEQYEDLADDLIHCDDKGLVHPQRVLDLYTYTRTQTAMTKEGVADSGSLRTIRVVNKENIFKAKLVENKKLTDDQKQLLKTAISMVKHIGTNRTRGLGLVELALLEEEEKKQQEVVSGVYGSLNKIHYEILLQSPVLFKSPVGSQEKTQDYIEGSKILGILAQNLSKEQFEQLMGYENKHNAIVASNAYICRDGERCTPVSASLQKVKDQMFAADGTMQVADMLSYVPGQEQWTPVGKGYISSDRCLENVELTMNYHHSRTEDKSIGKATGKDGSAFYQLAAVKKGQKFAGYILADDVQAPIVENVLRNVSKVRMGAGRNAEYGKVKIVLKEIEKVEKTESKLVKEFAVKCNSSMILYNEYGMPCADVKVFKEYLAAALGVDADKLQLKKAFLNYDIIGGFNVTWNRRKPTFDAIGKGSVCSFSVADGIDAGVLEHTFLGERTSEGYGEIEVITEIFDTVILKKPQEISGDFMEEKTQILLKLHQNMEKEKIAGKAVNEADKLLNSNKGLLQADAALSKLIMIVKNESTYAGIQEQVRGIESQEKQKQVKQLLGPVNDFRKKENDSLDQEEAVQEYLYHYLKQIKYTLYQEKKGEDKKK